MALILLLLLAVEALQHGRAACRARGGYKDDFDEGWNGEAYVGDDYEPARRREPKLPVPDRKTGLIMMGAGAALTMLGVSLFFEKNLIRLGNLLLVTGSPIVVGPARAARYLADPSKLRGSLVFTLGFFLVLSGHPLLGIVVELFGFFNLFGNLFPLLGAMISRLPFISALNGGPGLSPDLDPRDAFY